MQKTFNGKLVKKPQLCDASTGQNDDCLFFGNTCTAFHVNRDIVLYLKTDGNDRIKISCIEGTTYYLPCTGISTDKVGTTKPEEDEVSVFFYDFN